MQYKIQPPRTLQAKIKLPASKSISNRALILHALTQGNSRPQNLSDCDDTNVMVNALQNMPETIDIMAAGTAMRFLTAYLCVTPGEHIITGTQRMQQRPIRILVDALRSIGASIEYVNNEGYPPLRISGKLLRGGSISLPGDVSSQYISALLMIAPTLPQGLQLELTGNIISFPYINLTLQLMKKFGVEDIQFNGNTIKVKPGQYQDVAFLVENDWSAASYWYQMLALQQCANKDYTIKQDTAQEYIELLGLFPNSYQGDSRGAQLFEKLGVQTEYTEQGVRLSLKGKPVEYLEENLVDIPDLAQTFVVTCCLMNIPFRFTGLQSLKIKETDRIEALITELHKLGFVLQSANNSIISWQGERCQAEETPVIATYEDHRMAMAFAPACQIFGQVKIAHPHVVSKSYPNYWKDLKLAGFSIEEESL